MVRISVHRGNERRAEVAALFGAVYTPEVLAAVPWRDIQSSSPETRILVHDGDCLVATAGLVSRDALHNGRPVTICGIGGVATLPSKQRCGFGRAAMLEAHSVGISMYSAQFGLLFCEPKNAPFYASLDWAPFAGTVIVEQEGQKRMYDIMVAMVRPLAGAPPLGGTIDILGLPW